MYANTGMRSSICSLNMTGFVVVALLAVLVFGNSSVLAAGAPAKLLLDKGDDGSVRKWTIEFLSDGTTPGEPEEFKSDSQRGTDGDF